VPHRAQRQRHAEDILGQLLQAALAEVVAAAQIRQGGGEARTDAVRLELGRYGGVVEGAAAGAGAEVTAVLGDLGGQRRHLGDLVPSGLGVVGCRPRGQQLVAAPTVVRDEVVDMLEALGWESPPEVGGVAQLSSGGASGGLLGGQLGGVERVGGGRDGGVGGVAAELRFQLADAVLRGVETLAQVGDDLITLPTS
jgi:hypothetical protein